MSLDVDRSLAGAVITPAAPLMLPSGRLIAAEPGTGFPVGEAARWAFAETVAPGAYPVEIVHRDGLLIAARVVVRPEPVAAWRPAQRDGEPYVYPVDGGAGSFGSPEVFEALTDDEAREDLIADLSFDSDEAYAVYTDPASGANLVSFQIGADGRYPTWIGWTAAGDIACFLTDFGELEHQARR
ncbi:DUF4241 domain-containing protein [Paractinoplanes brasiliensis]|uniref:Uncharacterized protein DUF4241 n=1 Tax=Paractinoplanes brasiliensis TaxID=52695 RepID=A0A4R6K0D7_9ACTN|nr:DUF4241 domain-containing protein [Actinoplanes brasiliensis]TDO41672.1 uncharacterized protein DUF4241 [Actinoplanes brasiliensis]GID27041.1 hypothetical protein Abr02nite_20240 [Actinoplanes brasiliensis]